jgi:hypothetical protein
MSNRSLRSQSFHYTAIILCATEFNHFIQERKIT